MKTSFWSKLLMTSTTFALVLVPALAQAADGEGASAMSGLSFLAVALGAGLAALGGTLGQSRAASAALEGITRNPNASNKVFVPLLLSLALIESLVLVTWVLMNTMLSKI